MDDENSVGLDKNLVPIWLRQNMLEVDQLLAVSQPYPFLHPDDLSGYICLHQNDYLRLSEREEVRRVKADVVQSEGNSFLAATVFAGGRGAEQHQAFRSLLASAMQADDVLLASSGWTGNVGLIEALAQAGTPIYLDQKAHASCWDGARLSAGRSIMVRHNDPASLLARVRRDGPGVVCIDSFYSTTGEVCDLAAYVEICEKTGSVLVLDEAHSLGMIGPGAGGLAVELGLADRVHFRTASFSKALGGHGGCIATSRHLAWFLSHRIRPILFSSAALPCDSAAHRQALSIARAEPWLARHCLEMGALFRSELEANGVGVYPSVCQIVSIPFATVAATCKAYGMLRERGVLSSVFMPPATPKNTGLLRFSLHAQLSQSDVLKAAHEVADVLDLMGLSHHKIAAA